MQQTIEEKNVKNGIIWNLASYILLGIFTIISYCLISWNYGTEELGSYSIVLSVFMICGHIGVWGLQSAAMYYVPQESNREEKGKFFSSFFVITMIVGSIVGGMVYTGADFIGNNIFQSELVVLGLKRLPLAIILFSINKMIAGYINALGEMRIFAILQGLRYWGIVGGIILCLITKKEFGYIFLIFLFSEIIVSIVGLYIIFKKIRVFRPNIKLMSKGIRFGYKAMLGNVISDINTKIDVIMLGILCEDTIVGKYSFITIIAEGLLAILLVYRNNYNPLFSTLIHQKKVIEVKNIYDEMKKKLWKLFGVLSVVVTVGYGIFCKFFLDEGYMISVAPAAIICLGCMVMGPYFVGGNLCTLSGKPIIDTSITMCTIVANAVLNYVLISIWELSGAALATSLSYIIYSVLTAKMVNIKVWNGA